MRTVLLACWAVLVMLGPVQARNTTYDGVRVPVAPQRVISLAPSATEIVYALDRGDLLKGATVNSDFPEAAGALPRVGTYDRPDVERILALEPDLCLSMAGMTPPETIDRLRQLGVSVFPLKTDTLGAVLQSIRNVGELLDARSEAGRLVEGMRREMDTVKKTYGHAPKPRVLYQIGGVPMYSACGGTFINELIEVAGGENVCAAIQGYPQLTREQAVAFAPDVILIPTMGHGAFEAEQKHWRQWTEIPAIRDARIFILNSDLLDRPGPRIVEGLRRMAELLHAESPGGAEAVQ